jgi:hypothetical protein
MHLNKGYSLPEKPDLQSSRKTLRRPTRRRFRTTRNRFQTAIQTTSVPNPRAANKETCVIRRCKPRQCKAHKYLSCDTFAESAQTRIRQPSVEQNQGGRERARFAAAQAVLTCCEWPLVDEMTCASNSLITSSIVSGVVSRTMAAPGSSNGAH